MNKQSEHDMREIAWRRDLSQAEKAKLAPLPVEEQLDSALGKAIRSLPEIPVASNFTARVLQAIEQEVKSKPTRRSDWLGWLSGRRAWLPRLAAVGLVCVLALGGWNHHRAAERAKLADSIRQMAGLANAPAPTAPANLEVWENFETIRRLGTTAGDEELLGVVIVKQ
jgi:hypothetical protein